MRVRTGDLRVGRHPVVGMRRPLFGGQERQQRGQRIEREALPRREVQVLAAQRKPVARLMIAHHRPVRGDHVHAQIKERKGIV